MSDKPGGFAAAVFILGLVGLIYAVAQNAGALPEFDGISPILLGFFGIVGMIVGGYYLSE